MQGVVNFLSSISRSHEQAASDWAKDKRRLEARVLDLELQCKARDRIQCELIDRVKLLEAALRKERSEKNTRRILGSSTICFQPNIDRSSLSINIVHDNESTLANTREDDKPCNEEDEYELLFRDGSAWGERDEPEQDCSWFWQPYAVLRSHLDCVTGVCFHERGALLLSLSADASLKLWSLKTLAAAAAAWGAAGPATVPPDIEPVITYRGHAGAVLCSTRSTCALGRAKGMFPSFRSPLVGSRSSSRVWPTAPVFP